MNSYRYTFKRDTNGNLRADLEDTATLIALCSEWGRTN